VPENAPSGRSAAALARRVRKWIADRSDLSEAGFSLLEAVVAITVLLVVIVPATYMIDTAVQQTASARASVAATELAEQGLEQLGSDPLSTLEGYLDTNHKLGTYIVAGISYSVSSYLTWQGAGNVPDLCQSGSPPQEISATATVSWGPGYHKLAEQSVITPLYGLPVFYLATAIASGSPGFSTLTASTAQTIAGGSSLTVGADTAHSVSVTVAAAGVNNSTTIALSATYTSPYSFAASTTPVSLPNEGYLAVQVNGASGSAPANVGSVTVSIQPSNSAGSPTSGTTATVYTPDSNGCVFAQEVPGYYTVTLGSTSAPPFVNTSDNNSGSPVYDQNPSLGTSPVLVSADSTIDSPWTFDQSDTVTFAPTITTPPIAGGIPVSVLNSGIPGNDWYTVITSAASTAGTTTANLYPFGSSYSAWYGDCLAEEPAVPATVAASEGGTTTVTMGGLSTLSIKAENTATPTPGLWSNATVSATIADPNLSTDSCTADALTLPQTATTGISQAQVVEVTRTDTATWATSSSTIADTSIQAADVGKEVMGTGIPVPSYIGTVTAGASFKIYNTPIVASQTAGNLVTTTVASTTGSTVNLETETYSVSVTTPSPDLKTGTAVIVVTPGGVVCTSGCTTATTNVFYPASGTNYPLVQIS